MKIIFCTLSCEKFVRINGQVQNSSYSNPGLIRYLPQFNFIPSDEKVKNVFEDFSIDFQYFEQCFPEYANIHSSTIRSLSGGAKRLIETFILIKAKTEFVLLDEPFSHISPLQVEKLKELILDERPFKGFLITDQVYQHVVEISTTLYLLSNQKTRLINSISDLQTFGYTNLTEH